MVNYFLSLIDNNNNNNNNWNLYSAISMIKLISWRTTVFGVRRYFISLLDHDNILYCLTVHYCV